MSPHPDAEDARLTSVHSETARIEEDERKRWEVYDYRDAVAAAAEHAAADIN
jgi:hypothetical protein